jgi:hypothetical protein
MQGRLRTKDHPVAIVTSLEEEQRALDELLAEIEAIVMRGISKPGHRYTNAAGAIAFVGQG